MNSWLSEGSFENTPDLVEFTCAALFGVSQKFEAAVGATQPYPFVLGQILRKLLELEEESFLRSDKVLSRERSSQARHHSRLFASIRG